MVWRPLRNWPTTAHWARVVVSMVEGYRPMTKSPRTKADEEIFQMRTLLMTLLICAIKAGDYVAMGICNRKT